MYALVRALLWFILVLDDLLWCEDVSLAVNSLTLLVCEALTSLDIDVEAHWCLSWKAEVH